MTQIPEDKKETKKNLIMEAAARVFNKRGFNDARMDDVVEEAKVSKGTLYWYFKSKEELFFEIVNKFLMAEFSYAEQINQEDISPTEKLLKFMDFLVTDIKKFTWLLPLMFDFLVIVTRNKTSRKILYSYLQTFKDSIHPMLEEGIKSGEFRAADPDEVFLTIGSLIEGTFVLWVYDPDIDVTKQMEAGIKILLQGILADPEKTIKKDK